MVDLIGCFDHVRELGAGRWLARCPGPLHENGDRHPSLGVRQTDDGTWLLRCYSGCETEDVLAALALTWSDVFPPSASGNRHERRQPTIPARDALAALDHEAHVVAIIGADLLQHRELEEDAWQRLATAVQRIGAARTLVHPERIK